MILILELRLLFSEEQNVEVSDTCLPAGRQQKFNTCLPADCRQAGKSCRW
jgi:hypothetical protein